MGIISQKLRDSAKGQSCTLRTHRCNHNPETTVLAHLPSTIKGVGNKGDDWHAVFACSECHYALDHHAFPMDDFVLDAIQRTQRIWFEMGLLKVPVTEKRKKQSDKILPRRPLGHGNLWEAGLNREE